MSQRKDKDTEKARERQSKRERERQREKELVPERGRRGQKRGKKGGWMREWENQGGERKREGGTMYHHEVRRRGGRNAADAEQKRSALSAMLFAGITVSNLSLLLVVSSCWYLPLLLATPGTQFSTRLRPAFAGYRRAARVYRVLGNWRCAVSRFVKITFSPIREREKEKEEREREREEERSQPPSYNQRLKAKCNLDDGLIDNANGIEKITLYNALQWSQQWSNDYNNHFRNNWKFAVSHLGFRIAQTRGILSRYFRRREGSSYSELTLAARTLCALFTDATIFNRLLLADCSHTKLRSSLDESVLDIPERESQRIFPYYYLARSLSLTIRARRGFDDDSSVSRATRWTAREFAAQKEY